MTMTLLEHIAVVAKRCARLEAQLKEARDERAELIRQAAAAHLVQADVARASGLTRERIRIIVDPSKRVPSKRAPQQ